MQSIKKYVFFLIVLMMASCSLDDTKEHIPLETFFAAPDKTSFLVSPDGKFISYLKPENNRIHIYVETWDRKNTIQLTCDTNSNIPSYFWASNDEILYLKTGPANKDAALVSVKIDGSRNKQLISAVNSRIRIITNNKVFDNHILVALNQRDSTVFDAYRLNIKTGKFSMLSKNPGNITKWYSDPEGKLRLAIESDGVNETLLYRDSENQKFNSVIKNNFKTTILPLAFSSENNCIYALSNQNRDKMALVELDCKTGKEHRTIYSNPDVDVSEAIFSVKNGKLLYAAYETWKKELHYIDESFKNIFQKLELLLPNTEIRLISSDLAERKFIVRTYTDRNPGSFYQYIPENNKLVKLSDINPQLLEEDMSEMKPIIFKTRDSLLVNGYLTLPKGKKSENLPVVVLPHSSSDGRNSWGYNSEVQFLANRGYAVFQMNFRGTKGYGKNFWIAGFKEWGGKMQNDITDGVRWLISEKIADPKRIAIYGYSFGGFSALHGLVNRSNLYQCGASYSGFTNLYTYLKDIPPYFRPYQQMYYETVGNPEKDSEYFRAVSPVFHTDKIKVPVLIAQGARDPRVNMNETNQFVKELKKKNVPVTYILKEDEGHYFRNIENRLEFYRELEVFLDKNLSRK